MKPKPSPSPSPAPSICQQAHALIHGPRRATYGDARESFTEIAFIWSIVLDAPVNPRQVALCMVALKLCREANAHSLDNLVDGAAYFDLAGQVSEPPSGP